MRPQPAHSPAPDGAERPPAFTRRIECDGEGYAAVPRTHARGGGMREPGGGGRERRHERRG